MLFVQDANRKNKRQLTMDNKNESDAVWIGGGQRIAFLRDGEIWVMTADGKNRQQLSHTQGSIEGFTFSPDEKKVVYIKSIPYHGTIRQNPSDLPKATGLRITDMNYRHWDHYVETIVHPFVADVTANGINEGKDIMEGEPYESPVAPFGGSDRLPGAQTLRASPIPAERKKAYNMPFPRIQTSISTV